jgi:Fur family transcriptional regulator, peroxide stress response regulator
MEAQTKQFRKRNAILAYLRQSKAHPSAEDIYRDLQQEHSDISLASIYRNLKLFKDEGLIISLGTVNGIERFDGRTDPHVHFACSICGAVVDVPDMNVPESVIQAAASQLDCRVDDAQLMLTGVCRRCLQGKENH